MAKKAHKAVDSEPEDLAVEENQQSTENQDDVTDIDSVSESVAAAVQGDDAHVPESEVSEVMAVEAPAEKDAEIEVQTPEKQFEEKAKNTRKAEKKTNSKKWPQIALLGLGLVSVLLIIISGIFSQVYKMKALPNVSVAGAPASLENEAELKKLLEEKYNNFSITLSSEESKAQPALKELGVEVDIQATAKAAIEAKRENFLDRFSFWEKREVPAVVVVNDTILNQYLDAKFPKLGKAGVDARLVFNETTGNFSISSQQNGSGPDVVKVKSAVLEAAEVLQSKELTVTKINKPAKITEAKLKALVEPANEITTRRIVLSGQGSVYQATPSDIAQWITPTPEKNGDMKLVIDPAKVQSYIESIGKNISSAPQDKKVIKDKKTGKTVVLQEGRNGTELAGKQALVARIIEAVDDGRDVSLTMEIKNAAFKTVDLKGYDKWIEVDLSEQRVTAYEGARPVNSFIVATGLPGFDTPVGEYAVWLKVRKQTMQGGSKADGSYYNIPNVEWVSYFYQDYALHGAWWRKKFGAPASHGCVNMTNADAQWVYNWVEIGTKVIVHY